MIRFLVRMVLRFPWKPFLPQPSDEGLGFIRPGGEGGGELANRSCPVQNCPGKTEKNVAQ